MNVNNAEFWQAHYERDDIGWDMGEVSPPLKAYFDKKFADVDKSSKILIAGAGNAHEAKYLHDQGFGNVYVVDFAKTPLDNLSNKLPSFPKEHLIQADFFTLTNEPFNFANFFDIAIEQTFFCAIDPARRSEYAQQMHKLLKPTGKIVGVLWDCYFPHETQDPPEFKPPFGGNKDEYQDLFTDNFDIAIMQKCNNSHPARQGRELFVVLVNN